MKTLLLCLLPAVALADFRLYDEGADAGIIKAVDCVGGGITCSRTGSKVTVFVDGGSSGLSQDTADDRYVPTLGGSLRQFGGDFHRVSGSGVVNVGLFVAAATSGTASGPSDDTDAWYTNYACAASANAICGWRETNVNPKVSFGPRHAFRVKWPDASDLLVSRIWIAYTSSNLDQVESSAALSYFGLRYDTEAGDTAWQCCSSDATTASCVATSPNSVPAASGVDAGYVFELDLRDPATGVARINGTQVCSKATNLPASTVQVKYNVIQTTLEATAKNIRISSGYAEYQ